MVFLKALYLTICFLSIYTCFPLVSAVGNPGDPCTSVNEEAFCATSTTFLTCDPISNTCECQDTYFESGACVLGAYANCTLGTTEQQCGFGSNCSEILDTFKCRCLNGTTDTGEGKCRVWYGQDCDVSEGRMCDPGAVCSVGKCECIPGTGHNGMGKCRVIASGVCDATSDRLCDVGAQCEASLCQCIDGTSDNGLGRCRASYDAPCDKDKLCDESRFQACHGLSSKCVCLADTIYLDGECVSLYNRPCNVSGFPLTCDLGAECVDSMCACVNGTAPSDGKCRAAHGAECDLEKPCDDQQFQVCSATTDTCECKADTTFWIDQCVTLVDKPCDVEGYPKQCDIGADCVNNTCSCVEGATWSNGKCRVMAGGRCDFFDLVCDVGAVCTNYQCECMEGTVENERGECRVGLGGACGDNEPLCDETKFLECGATSGRCECVEGMVDNGMGECRANLGGSCSVDVQCDEFNFLYCDVITQKCVCRPDFVDNGKGQCRVMVGGACEEDKQCDTFALCGIISNVCACENGFQENGHGKCRVVLGGICGEDAHCDEDNHSQCSNENTCECIPPFVPDENDVCQVALNKWKQIPFFLN